MELDLPDDYDNFDDALSYSRDEIPEDTNQHGDGFDSFRRTYVTYSDAFSGIEEIITEMNGGSL